MSRRAFAGFVSSFLLGSHDMSTEMPPPHLRPEEASSREIRAADNGNWSRLRDKDDLLQMPAGPTWAGGPELCIDAKKWVKEEEFEGHFHDRLMSS
jgi:hypothetical protein